MHTSAGIRYHLFRKIIRSLAQQISYFSSSKVVRSYAILSEKVIVVKIVTKSFSHFTSKQVNLQLMYFLEYLFILFLILPIKFELFLTRSMSSISFNILDELLKLNHLRQIAHLVQLLFLLNFIGVNNVRSASFTIL